MGVGTGVGVFVGEGDSTFGVAEGNEVGLGATFSVGAGENTLVGAGVTGKGSGFVSVDL